MKCSGSHTFLPFSAAQLPPFSGVTVPDWLVCDFIDGYFILQQPFRSVTSVKVTMDVSRSVKETPFTAFFRVAYCPVFRLGEIQDDKKSQSE